MGRPEATAVLGLRQVGFCRGQWAFGAGFPVAALPRYEKLAVEWNWLVAVVREGG